MKATCRKLRSFVREEAASSKEYAKLGYPSQAKDEARHSRYFKKLIKRCNK